MMNFRISTLVLSLFLLLCCADGTAARADGMPFQETKPEPILAPLDKALNEIQPVTKAEAAQPPIEVAKPPVTPASPSAEAANPLPVPPPEPPSRTVEVQPNTSFFGLSIGMYDPFTHHTGGTSLNAEWQPGVKIAGFLQPLFGAIVTTRGSLLGYGGIGVPFHLTDHVMMMPSVAIGAYSKGNGYDLNHTLVYRVGTELAYQFDDQSRVGLNIHVLSGGGSLAQKDRTEVVGLAYTMPMNIFSKDAPAPASTTQTPSPLQ